MKADVPTVLDEYSVSFKASYPVKTGYIVPVKIIYFQKIRVQFPMRMARRFHQ